MKTIKQQLKRFVASDDGPTTTEYAVMLAVICVAVLSALSMFGVKMENIYTTLNSTLQVF